MNPDQAAEVAATGLVGLVILIPLLGFAYFAFWVITLIHCATKCPQNDRITWVLLVIFVPFIGSVLYWFLAPKPSMPPKLPAR